MVKEEYFGSDFLYFFHYISNRPTEGFQQHVHAMYELFFCLEGDVEYRIEDSVYTPAPESLLLVAPYKFHGFKVNSGRPYHRLSVHVLPGFLGEGPLARLAQPFLAGEVYYPDTSAYRLEHFYRAIEECAGMDSALREVAVASRLTALLTQVYAMYAAGAGQQARCHQPVQQVLDYLNRNLAGPIGLDALARRFYISKNHLNVLFRQATGTTVNQYVRAKRLARAQSLILGGMAAGSAAAEVGFGDYSNFYRAYKATYGYGPADSDASRLVSQAAAPGAAGV